MFAEDLSVQAANHLQDTARHEPDIILSKVENAMQHTKMRKALGLNDIPAELIKNIGQNETKPFLCLLKKIRKTQQWPDEWQKSVFIPLPKKGDVTNVPTII